MKKYCILLLVMTQTILGHGQQTKPVGGFDRNYYLKKCGNQKIAAALLLSVGGVSTTVGLLMPPAYRYNRNNYESRFDYTIKHTLEISGLVLMGAGVAFILSSANNNRKAAAASACLKMENNMSLSKGSLIQNTYPALSLKIML